MPLPTPKRPRFLDVISEPSQVAPFAFSHNPSGPARARSSAEERRPPAPAPPAPAPELEEMRRQTMERVGDALRSLRVEAERLAEQARADALEVAFQVAARILETEVKANPETLFALVRSALRKAGDSRRIALHLSPGDAAALQNDLDRVGRGDFTAARVEVVPDPTLGPGDCLVETDFGQVDGRLATRLSEAKRAVREAIEGGAA